jgi:uncharacterized membrane protein
MAFCPQCGTSVGGRDQFCGRCGSQQPGSPQAADFWSNLSPRNTAVLCYLPWVGWIAGIAVLASARFRAEARIRFHAFQGLYLFVAWLMIDWVVSPFFRLPGIGFGAPFARIIPGLLQVAVVGAWIFMLIKVTHDEDYRLPILGELADRSVSEQRS